MPCFGRIPKIEFKFKFDKKKFSIRKFKKCVGKEAFYSCAKKQAKLLKRQRKAQKECSKKLRKQQRKREKRLRSLKRAACCPPLPPRPASCDPYPCNPPPCHSSPCDPPPCHPPPCNPPPSQPPPCNPPPCYNPPPCKRSLCRIRPSIHRIKPMKIPKCRRIPPCKIRSDPCSSISCRSSSDCCCSKQPPQTCQADTMGKQSSRSSSWPRLACISSSGPLNVKCKCKKRKKKKKKKKECSRRKPRNLCFRCIIYCSLIGTIAFCAGISIPILAGIIPAP